ncbi:MAG TPA: UDP-N-acetylmuramate--L-alanine ligase [Candidatus Omnitrophota bacterium]|nr:UDP-N-acetylmuramate--L-alanine ligase [Candidatus Omnitrophota bacterium]HOX09175.1 UDP-N-acetylmuramate--L-alanine ligase [Candidatus Omnitrophota bacterium]HPN65965.1 UDP-N-acetylmuramate--L-alanine ligase [Candidatus Omnitrophota bacterium]HRZ67486.1 UDP-N-acetylmuramate--L-alanine ligase [Candidatus Omnitrophota bacterium]
MTLKGKMHIHFIGIGGIGMSAIAFVLLKQGHKVSGSDIRRSRIVEKLESLGGVFHEGHHEKNIKGADIVVFSSSITPENPEVKAARNKKVKTLHRADMLALIMNDRKGIAVTGAHGKTTTSSLIAHILYRAGLDPTAILGGEVRSMEGNARVGGGEHFVVEADESDGSFVHLKPFYSVVTNIDAEHMDYYRNMGEIISWYLKFIEKIKEGGKLFACGDCENLRRALRGCGKEVFLFGLSKENHIYPDNVAMHDSHSEFEVVYRGSNLGAAAINIPGIHNVSNALAAFAVALELGLDFNTVKSAVEDFTGAARRFQVKYSGNGVKVIDDYAHHPSEIRATIAAARNWKPKRIIVAFQPHRFSRTKYLKDQFGRCFDAADKVVLTDIYAASEDELDNVSGRSIYEEVSARGHRGVSYIHKKELKGLLLKEVKRGDMVLMMGAGDITNIADELARDLPPKLRRRGCRSKKKT